STAGAPGGRGPGESVADNAELQQLIEAADNRWAAATIGSMSAGALELETGVSVMAIGGFTGGDDSPTLGQCQTYVADGQVRYFIAGGRGGPAGNSGSSSEISSWVGQNFTAMEIGGVTVYDLQD
ncbi:MAG: glycosyl transferase, partial [Mycobacterium sp.]|nr:glycosyl transferase [Mycobacterium sp.]